MDPLDEPPERVTEMLSAIASWAVSFTNQLDGMPALAADDGAWSEEVLAISENGVGSWQALSQLSSLAERYATGSAGPRYYDFVVGGTTPAALAADWIVSSIDQNAAGPGSSDFATKAEQLAIELLIRLFSFPPEWTGVLSTSAMTANLTALGAATDWWALQLGTSWREQGIARLPRIRVFSSRLVHFTVLKAVQILGHGRQCLTYWEDSSTPGASALGVLERELDSDQEPKIVIATAGDANSGRFDDIQSLAEVCNRTNTWLHVDAAFGLGARLVPDRRSLLAGIDKADSVAADTHKWLNMPYDSGFTLVGPRANLGRTFGVSSAPYLPQDLDFEGFSTWSPEGSRRARALPVLASMMAFGRSGLSELANRLFGLGASLAARVEEDEVLELMAPYIFGVVCFRIKRPWADESMNRLNALVVQRVKERRRFSVGKTVISNRVCIRVAIVNWRTTSADVWALVDEVKDVASSISSRELGEHDAT